MPVRDSKEYALVKSFYGDRKAGRSRVPLINHIDEGLALLEEMGAPETAMKAFCLHPLFQTDAALLQNHALIADLDPYVVALILEYRNIANAYLSQRTVEKIGDIALSPLPEVNQMLKADKIQNFKDFMIHHYGTHPRSAELHRYFKNWFERLGIAPDIFTALEQRGLPGKKPSGNIGSFKR